MSMAPLLGLPGKVKTLVDRLTSTRATNLDNLDAAITTRAASATALSSATWTGARAGYLDLLNTHLDANTGIMLPKFQLLTSGTTWTRPAGHVGDVVFVTGIAGGQGGSRNISSIVTMGGYGGEAIDRYPYTVSGNVTYSIGAGGARRTGSDGTGTAGGNTTFGTITLRGGSSASNIGTLSIDDQTMTQFTGNHMGRLAEGWAINRGTITALGGRGLIIAGTQYGTGGRGDTNSDAASTDGLAGCLLIEWWEYA